MPESQYGPESPMNASSILLNQFKDIFLKFEKFTFSQINE